MLRGLGRQCNYWFRVICVDCEFIVFNFGYCSVEVDDVVSDDGSMGAVLSMFLGSHAVIYRWVCWSSRFMIMVSTIWRSCLPRVRFFEFVDGDGVDDGWVRRMSVPFFVINVVYLLFSCVYCSRLWLFYLLNVSFAFDRLVVFRLLLWQAGTALAVICCFFHYVLYNVIFWTIDLYSFGLCGLIW